jgi:4-hydroxybenzoyl-CoA reductase subunit alpha
MPRVHSSLVPSYEIAGPWGVKEVGEGATLPTMGCFRNAIFDAMGVSVNSLPLTPEKVWAALREKRKANGEDVWDPMACECFLE